MQPRLDRLPPPVLDLGLPDGDGVALRRALRRDGVRTPIIMLAATAAPRIGIMRGQGLRLIPKDDPA